MFVLYDRETMKIPVKVWLENEKELEASCREQALHLANLPFLAGPVCLMPDTHAGMGMPIGGVIASEDVIIPNAVGVDIGCGMAYTETGIRADDLRQIMTGSGNLVQAIIGDIMRNVPVGFAHHKQPMPPTSWTGHWTRWTNMRRTANFSASWMPDTFRLERWAAAIISLSSRRTTRASSP